MGLLLKRILTLLWRLLLATFGFIIGLGCSILFYEFSLRETDFDDAYKVLMFLSTAVFLSIGFAFSRQMACMTLLTLPEFVGRAGRRSLQATILILILAGPIKNLGENAEETLRFLTCVKDMLWDIFMAGVDLVLAPVQHILTDLKKSASEKQQDKSINVSLISKVMMPVREEIEGDTETLQIQAENDRIDRDMNITRRSVQLERQFALSQSANEAERIVKKYKKKVAYRCAEIFSKGTQSCMRIFQQKYDECCESVGTAFGWFEFIVKAAAWIVCSPMKLDFVCNVLSDLSMDSTCNEVEGLVNENFGETYVLVKRGIDDFTKGFHFQINYLGLSEVINMDSLKQKRDELLEQFLESKKYVQWYLTLIKRGLSLSYIFVVLSALNYHQNYFSKLSYDNIYLSQRFTRIDRRRRLGRRKKTCILPLKSFEKEEVTSLKRFWLTAAERKKFANQLFAIGLEAATVFTIFALDHIFKELLGLLQNHAEIEIKQEGIHVLAIQVKGEGFLAKLMRMVVKDFSVRKKIDMKHFTKPCLPHPRETPTSYHQRIIVLFCVRLANAYFEAHFARFRHCITDWFYPKRFKKRVVWLYNELLRRRRRKVAHLKRKVLENADRFRVYVPQNPVQLLAHFFPKRCACLKRCKAARRKCILCLANGAIYNCPRCGFAWCSDCFSDVDQRCLLCIAEREQEMKQKDIIEHTSSQERRSQSRNRTKSGRANINNTSTANNDHRAQRQPRSQSRHRYPHHQRNNSGGRGGTVV